ncbi:MAG: carbohydrate binding domain-containing protein [Thermodesulfobacteriota bacterium]
MGRIVAYSLTFLLGIYTAWTISKAYLVDRQLNKLLLGAGPQSQSLTFDPEDASYHYLLGRYFQYTPLMRDLKKAEVSYSNAILLNPVKAEHWVDLARVKEAIGDTIDAEKAINRAVVLKPTGLNIHWETANFRLKRGEIKKALRGFRYIASNYPGERHKVYPLIWLSAKGDMEIILKEAIANEDWAKIDYLWYLIARKQKKEAKALWTIVSDTNIQSPIRHRYIDRLISWGDIADAKKEWEDTKGIKNDPNNLLWNKGFEESETLNRGFDWRIGMVKGADIKVDDKKAKEGSHSLRINFSGKENVDFAHVFQIVPLEPETRYILTASIMTADITTTNGIKIDFFGITGCKFYAATESVTGTNTWKKLKVEITTPKDCTAGRVRIRRNKSSKFNNLIDGTAWIDDFRLEKHDITGKKQRVL